MKYRPTPFNTIAICIIGSSIIGLYNNGFGDKFNFLFYLVLIISFILLLVDFLIQYNLNENFKNLLLFETGILIFIILSYIICKN